MQLRADSEAQFAGLCARVQPEHAQFATAGAAQTLEAFDGRRLSGAVAAEQAEDLALRDLEAGVGDGNDVLVAFLEVLDGDDGRHEH